MAIKRGPESGSLAMLFDFEVEEHHAAHESRSCVDAARLAALEDRLAYLACPLGDYAARLLEDVGLLKRALLREGGAGKVDAALLALRLSLVGYPASVRTACGGGAACFRNLSHQFVVVQGPQQEEYIVDAAFRDHFTVPHPSATYQRLLSKVPGEWVGSSSALVPLVQCLCMEMAESFQEQGLALPPWRRSQAMLSKWLPAKSRSRTISCCGAASDREGASPEACRSAAGGIDDAFQRMSDCQVLACQRATSSKSLLSGRLTSLQRTASNSSAAGTSSAASSAAGATLSGCSPMAPGLYKQPPVHASQPPSYKVKFGSVGAAYAAATAAAGHRRA